MGDRATSGEAVLLLNSSEELGAAEGEVTRLGLSIKKVREQPTEDWLLAELGARKLPSLLLGDLRWWAWRIYGGA